MDHLNSLFSKLRLTSKQRGKFIVKTYPLWMDFSSIKRSQKIAVLFKKQGVPAVSFTHPPVKSNGHYSLTFPFIEGTVLTPEQIETGHIEQIALLLEKIHQTRLNADFAPALETYRISMQDWQDFANALALIDPELGCFLKLQFHWLEKVNPACIKACSVAPNDVVISHRDLTLNNVIWQNKKPYVIDWDQSGKISQAQDVLATALNWSLKPDATVDRSLFSTFIKCYRSPLIETEWELGFYRVLANWLNWVKFNLEHYLKPDNPPEFKTKLAQQITYSLTAAHYQFGAKPLVVV